MLALRTDDENFTLYELLLVEEHNAKKRYEAFKMAKAVVEADEAAW